MIGTYALGGMGIIDVGTDHGHVPVYIAQHSENAKITASDLRKGPLDSARKTAAEYGVTGRIRFVLASGLDGAEKSETDTIIIAGMGGETIISILSQAPWALTGGIRLILQPQSKLGELEDWLRKNGSGVSKAVLVRDEGRIYSIWLCEGMSEKCVDRILMDNRDKLMPDYLDEKIKKLSRAVEGMEKAENHSSNLEIMRARLEEYKKMRGETELWRL